MNRPVLPRGTRPWIRLAPPVHQSDGKADKRQVAIRQLDAAGGGVTNTWVLEGAWPCRWAGPAFDASATEVAMEEIELAFDRLTWR
jgi:phage tail-like protein